MSNGGVCRTAPATPGLLKIIIIIKLKKSDMWQVTRDRWHVTGEMWKVTGDRWHMTPGVGWTFSQNFSSLAWFGSYDVLKIWRKRIIYSVNQLMNDKAVRGTAPATPGLLISVQGKINIYLCRGNEDHLSKKTNIPIKFFKRRRNTHLMRTC